MTQDRTASAPPIRLSFRSEQRVVVEPDDKDRFITDESIVVASDDDATESTEGDAVIVCEPHELSTMAPRVSHHNERVIWRTVAESTNPRCEGVADVRTKLLAITVRS